MRRYLALVVLAPAVAHAQPLPWEPAPEPPPFEPPPPPAPAATTDEPAEPPPSPADLAARIEELETKEKQLAREQRREVATRKQVEALVPLQRFITVFVDVGAFAVAGDGSGIRSDLGHLYFPQYADRLAGQWVFMGDPLSTAVNAFGEPADTSDSRELPTDTIHSRGRPSFVVNTVGVQISRNVGEGFAINALAELLPRPGHDQLDIEYAAVEYRPFEETNLVLAAGKIDSVLGIEYRAQDAPKRLGVTPSLICRYTCGRPIGVRALLTEGSLILSASLTNRDNFDQRFEPDHGLKANDLPTAAGHAQWQLPVDADLQLGVSGAIGPQDGQSDLSVLQWHYGFDARLLDFHGFDATAEFVQGLQQGWTMSVPCDVAPCLDYKGAYLLVDRRVNTWFTPYVRFDWRDAVHQKGVDFVYESHVARATVGARFAVTSWILGKIEYTWNRELDNIPQFPDDILTTSIVVSTPP